VWDHYKISADSSQVVYRAHQDTYGVIELYSVPIGGGTTTKLSGPMVTGGDVDLSIYYISADCSRVVYKADQDTDEVFELYSTPIEKPPAPEIDVQGNGQSIPNGDTTPTPADDTGFGSVTLGSTPITHTFTISNSGGADLSLTGTPAVTLTVGTHFSVAMQPASPVVSNTTTTFDVTFDPSAAGNFVDTVNISNNDADENPYTFVISGTSVPPQPGYGSTPAPGSTINVGTAGVGRTVSTALTISETGEATLGVTPTLSGPDAGDFGFAPTTLSILNGGPAQDLTISCTPSFTGTLAGTLTVAHNASGSPAVYPLRCTGEPLTYIYLPLVLRNQ
jgi:hypothetical protein